MRKLVALASALAMVVTTVVIAPVAASGPGTWVYNPSTRHQYAQLDGVTWEDAEALGVRLGGHLVTVNDQAEQDWLMATFRQDWLWIGFNDRDHDGTWVWSSHEKVRYTNWGPGEPNDWKGFDPLGEPAATLSYPGVPQWADISDRWLGSGIIEVPGKPKSLAWNTLPTGTHDGTVDEVALAEMCYANGWAFDPDSPRRDVTVRILVMRTDLTQVPMNIWQGPASLFREDLQDAGFGDGTAAFWVDLRSLIAYGVPYEVRVQGRDVQTGEWWSLDSTPRQLTCWPY